jgi:hypothetical protein
MPAVNTPHEAVTQQYMRAFHALHGRPPRIRHMSGVWFQVNGEIVHKSTVEAEIERLRTLARKHRRFEKGMVNKIIERLRSL